MRKFIIELFTNRSGIVLAALNLCFFASRIHDFNAPPFGKIFVCLNLPSIGSTILALNFIKAFCCRLPAQTEVSAGNFLCALFIVFQWLFIAWCARKLNALPEILKNQASRR